MSPVSGCEIAQLPGCYERCPGRVEVLQQFLVLQHADGGADGRLGHVVVRRPRSTMAGMRPVSFPSPMSLRSVSASCTYSASGESRSRAMQHSVAFLSPLTQYAARGIVR